MIELKLIELKSPNFIPLSSSQLDEARESFSKMLKDWSDNTEWQIGYQTIKFQDEIVSVIPYKTRVQKKKQ